MSVTYVTFKCGACGKYNAVGDDMRGKPVRCPHCKKVVQVPSAEASTGGAAMVPTASTILPKKKAPDEMSFLVRPTQGDSIFVTPEGAGDALFDDDPSPQLDLPPLPEGTVEAPNYAVGGVEQGLYASPGIAATGWDGAEAVHQQVGATPNGPAAAGTFTATTVGPENPWANEPDLEAAPARPMPSHVPAAAPTARLPAAIWILALVIPYAIAMTAGAAFLYLKGETPPPHPLEALADQGLYEEFQEGRRREVVDPRTELGAAAAPLKLGESRRLGDIEITPQKVTKDKLAFTYYRGTRDYVKDEEALFLHLQIKNVSDQTPTVFHPNDATFNRAYSRDVKPYTFLDIGGYAYYGAVADVNAERLKGQNFQELAPGETMETVIVAHEAVGVAANSLTQEEQMKKAVVAVKSAKPDQPLVWRVHLRKGREKVNLTRGGNRIVWSTVVVPVTITPKDVQ